MLFCVGIDVQFLSKMLVNVIPQSVHCLKNGGIRRGVKQGLTDGLQKKLSGKKKGIRICSIKGQLYQFVSSFFFQGSRVRCVRMMKQL